MFSKYQDAELLQFVSSESTRRKYEVQIRKVFLKNWDMSNISRGNIIQYSTIYLNVLVDSFFFLLNVGNSSMEVHLGW
jgi:hypothetical protein